jgi:glycosyltransferase involved in cell wall biosynthesis
MRILMISDVYFPRVNGVSTSIQTYRRDLLALGHECTLVAPAYPGAMHGDRLVDDSDLVRIPSRGVPRDPEDRAMRRRRLLELTGRFRDRGYDVLHLQTPFVAHYAGLELARRLGLAVVESYHTYFEHYLHHYVPALPSAATRWLARRLTVSQCAAVRAVVAPSRQMAEALRAYGVQTPIEVLPTGLPPEAFERGERARFRSRHGIPDGRPVVLYVGRVAHEKNIDFLVRMLARLRASVPEALLIVAGEGPAERHLRQLVGSLGLETSVLFLGYMDRRRELPDCYSGADAFVFASRTETQGLVLLEALAQGTPVVSTAVMGTIDVLRGAGGAVVVEEQEDAFAAAVAAVLRDPQRRATLATCAARDAARWSSRALAQRLVGVYEALRVPRATIGAASATAMADDTRPDPGIRGVAG